MGGCCFDSKKKERNEIKENYIITFKVITLVTIIIKNANLKNEKKRNVFNKTKKKKAINENSICKNYV